MVDGFEVRRFEQVSLGGSECKVGFDVDHISLHVAAFDHGLEFAVVGGAVLDHINAAVFAEHIGPGFFLRVLGTAAQLTKLMLSAAIVTPLPSVMILGYPNVTLAGIPG